MFLSRGAMFLLQVQCFYRRVWQQSARYVFTLLTMKHLIFMSLFFYVCTNFFDFQTEHYSSYIYISLIHVVFSYVVAGSSSHEMMNHIYCIDAPFSELMTIGECFNWKLELQKSQLCFMYRMNMNI